MTAAAAGAAGVVALTGCSSSSSPSTTAHDGSPGITDASSTQPDVTSPTNSDDASDDAPSVVVFYGAVPPPGDRDASPGSATDASSDASESG